MASFYCNTLEQHQSTDANEIYGVISLNYSKEHIDQKSQQSQSWHETINIFKSIYTSISEHYPDFGKCGILYEYKIPRRAKRIDAVLLTEHIIFIIEVKVNQTNYLNTDIEQLEDYCLDVRDFHLESRNKIIVPILLATKAPNYSNAFDEGNDIVKATLRANKNTIADIILGSIKAFKSGPEIGSIKKWEISPYRPTPTIIEAAQALYAKQNVREISHSHADAHNLTATTQTVLDAIRVAQISSSKVICFITGVPGAGKTLAGLNIVHNREFQNGNEELGTFLSGNSPLVKVLSEALAKNFTKREKITKTEAKRRVKTFIHNVHEFIDEYYEDRQKLPSDHVIIYDEAQRAWTKEHKTRKSNGAITESEPEILLSIMDRLPDWGVIIALIGGGQEINTGEAGIREWGKSLETQFQHWKVYISPKLLSGDHSTGNSRLFETLPNSVEVNCEENLHLNVSIRSYKAQTLSHWVSCVLENKASEAQQISFLNLKDYPVFLTRDVNLAKKFLKSKIRGSRRAGLVASSGGRGLKALGYDPYYGLRGDSSQDELGAWYLNPSSDVRSSNFLEIVATEYAVQGLELDWVGILWDCDLRYQNGQWQFKQFRGTQWQNVENEERKQFILNKYRVLMTRAREGFVICVPEGDLSDVTRQPAFYDGIYEYLLDCGISTLKL